ncbi:hypothetical protein [Streptomyces sp. NPDC003023]|uniref:AMIN-like domain-containing (lipo)protein n=1 Tax=Streptomyces sp. NPDC003023 TaxID=3364675 RepID=UPI003698E67C
MRRTGRVWATVLALASLTLGSAALPAQTARARTGTVCPTGWGAFAKTRSVYTATPLVNVRTGRRDCFDRMVVEVAGADGSELGYSVRYVDGLYQHGSGDFIPVSGGAIIEIVVHAPAYDTSTGTPTYSALPGRSLPGVNLAGYRTFRDARFAGSLEGRAQFGLGVRARLPFRVLALDDRVVVDVAHTWRVAEAGTR